MDNWFFGGLRGVGVAGVALEVGCGLPSVAMRDAWLVDWGLECGVCGVEEGIAAGMGRAGREGRALAGARLAACAEADLGVGAMAAFAFRPRPLPLPIHSYLLRTAAVTHDELPHCGITGPQRVTHSTPYRGVQ